MQGEIIVSRKCLQKNLEALTTFCAFREQDLSVIYIESHPRHTIYIGIKLRIDRIPFAFPSCPKFIDDFTVPPFFRNHNLGLKIKIFPVSAPDVLIFERMP